MHTLNRVSVGAYSLAQSRSQTALLHGGMREGEDYVIGLGIRTGERAVEVRPRGAEPAAK